MKRGRIDLDGYVTRREYRKAVKNSNGIERGRKKSEEEVVERD